MTSPTPELPAWVAVGKSVAVVSRTPGTPMTFGTVEKINRTTVTVAGQSYRIEPLHPEGEPFHRSRYGSVFYLLPPDDDMVVARDQAERHDRDARRIIEAAENWRTAGAADRRNNWQVDTEDRQAARAQLVAALRQAGFRCTDIDTSAKVNTASS